MKFPKRDLPYVAIIACAVVALFYPFFLQGKILLPPNATSAYPWYGAGMTTEPHPQGSMDAVRENYITWAHHKTYLENGYAPYWNPSILAGNSLVANNFAIPFSPYKLLNLIFSAPVAWSWAQILKTFFNGLFTYLALRALKRSEIASTVGALGWMLSWPLAHQTQTTYNEGVAMLPILFFFTLRSYQAEKSHQQWMYGLAAALVAGFHFLSGNIQMSVYVFLMLLAFALYWTWENRKTDKFRPMITLMLVYIGGVLIGSVQIWTTYELLGYSIRGAAQTYQNKGILPYVEVSFLNPHLYFWRNFEFPELRTEYWLNDRWNPYIGIVPLFGMLLAVRFVRERLPRALMLMTFGLLAVLHLLYFRPIFNIASQLPFYDLLDQARFLIVLPFPLAILGAYGVDWLLEESPTYYPKLRPLLMLASLLLLLMLVGMVALMVFFDGEVDDAENLPSAVCAAKTSAYKFTGYELKPTPSPLQWTSYSIGRDLSPAVLKQPVCTDPATAFANQRTRIGTQILENYYSLDNGLFAISFIYVGTALVLIGLRGTDKITRSAAGTAFIALTLIDLVIFANVNVAATDDVYPTTPAIEFLQNQEDIFRINAKNNTLRDGQVSGEYSRYQNDHAWYLSSTLEPLIPNTAGLYGLQDIRGYESVYTQAYSKYLATIDGREEIFGAGAWLTNTITHPMLDMLNVKYVLSIESLDEPSLKQVYRGEIYIYENLNAVPRVMLYSAYTVLDDEQSILEAMTASDFDPHTQLFTTETLENADTLYQNDSSVGTASMPSETTITRYEPNHVTIEVNTPQDTILVLADMEYPGWKATIDGKETKIARANYLFRAIVVPAGTHTVEFRYDSAVVEGSLLVSIVSFCGIAAALLILIRRKIAPTE